jgi:hypothetical protein
MRMDVLLMERQIAPAYAGTALTEHGFYLDDAGAVSLAPGATP